jgi:hypothetical protein
MGAKRVVWHVGFERNLARRGSRAFEVRGEVPLSSEPPRIDCLLLRKIHLVLDDSAQTLRRLWPLLPYVAVVEYKSPSRPYRRGNLDRLWSYVHTYYADQQEIPRKRADGTELSRGMVGAPDVWERADLCAVLVVSARTPSLLDDVAAQNLAWEDLGDGYGRVTGGGFALYVVEIDVVGPAEGDDLLYSLGHGEPVTPETIRFWAELLGSKEAGMSMQDMEGYDELMAKLLDLMPPEQVLAHYGPEQRLAGLDRDHQALALSVEVLRALDDDYIRSLSPEVQAEIRRRLERRDH